MVQPTSTSLFLAGADVISVDSSNLVKNVPNLATSQKTQQRTKPEKQPLYHMKIVWRNVIAFFVLHSLAVYGLFKMTPKPATIIFCK